MLCWLEGTGVEMCYFVTGDRSVTFCNDRRVQTGAFWHSKMLLSSQIVLVVSVLLCYHQKWLVHYLEATVGPFPRKNTVFFPFTGQRVQPLNLRHIDLPRYCTGICLCVNTFALDKDSYMHVVCLQ